jgi:transcriptional regulator with XRE-family HTH domain
MKREELIKSPAWLLAHIQSDLYALIENYRVEHKMKKKDIAAKLGVSKGYVSQILNGEFDHKLSKLIELALAFGKIPKIEFLNIDAYTKYDNDRYEQKPYNIQVTYNANQVVNPNAETKNELFVVHEGTMLISPAIKANGFVTAMENCN